MAVVNASYVTFCRDWSMGFSVTICNKKTLKKFKKTLDFILDYGIISTSTREIL